MAAHAVDHHDRPDPHPSFDANPSSSSCSSSISDFPLETLPQTTYSPSRAVRHNQQRLSLDTFSVQALRQSLHESSSPDPRDFYLQYRNPFGYDGAGSFDDSNTSHRNSSHFRSPSTSTIRTREPTSPSDSRHGQSPSTHRLPAQRQVSDNFKSLLNKFNVNQDQVVPRPPGSIVSSRATSPSPARRSRARSQLHRVTSNGYPERLSIDTQSKPSSKPPADDTPISPATATRRPLFGEILPTGNLAGSTRKRSDSDGNMRTLNPVLVDVPSMPGGLDPSSPTAWYLGFTPSLDKVDTSARRAGHKRSRTDLGGLASITVAMQDNTPSQKELNLPKSTSQSRLPVPARRTSHASDTASSTPSTRSNSAMGRHAAVSPKVPMPPKGTSALPLPKSPSKQSRNDSAKSPARLGVTSPPRRRGQRGNHDMPKSPSLNAYISAPPQKQSPALRSSRPRQPVSMATTAASRARAVDKPGKISDRISSFNSTSKSESFRATRKPSRLLPELSNVDFKARRQQIEAAVKQGVEKEHVKEEKKAELKRAKEQRQKERQTINAQQATKANDELQSSHEMPSDDQQSGERPKQHSQTVTFAPEPASDARAETPHSPDLGDEHFVTPEEGPSPRMDNSQDDDNKTAADGRIAQAHSESGTAESPTDAIVPFALIVPQMQAPSQQPNDPRSTMTDTTFDTEMPEQTHPTEPTHRTMLSHIMQMRESTPSVSSYEDDDETSFEQDNDQDSIRAMLRRSGYFGRGFAFDTSSEHDDQEDATDDFDYSRFGDDRRWDMDSWTSSVPQQPSGHDAYENGAGSSFAEVNGESLSEATGESVCSTQQLLPTRYDPNEANANESVDNELAVELQRLPSFGASTDISQQYPNLARQAGWDSRRATKLYLQERGFDSSRYFLDRGKSDQDAGAPNQANDVAPPDGLVEDDPDAVLVPESRNVPKSDYVQHCASLNFRDDWEQASTSIVDWMKHAAAEEMAPKDSNDAPQDVDVSAEREGAETPRMARDSVGTARLSKVEGLSVSIQIDPPAEQPDSPTIPPPLPDHEPPPPPPKDYQVSPSVYSSRPSTTVTQNAPPREEESAIGPDLRLFNTNDSTLGPDLRLYETNESAIGPDLRLSEDTALSQAISGSTLQHDDDLPPPPPRKTPSPEERRLRKRANVMKELVDTEYNFCRDMAVVVDIYKGTSNSCGEMTSDDVRVLFGNSDQVAKFSTGFLDVLKAAAKSVYVLSRDQLWMVQRDSNSNEVETVQAQPPQDAEPLYDDQKDRETWIGGAFLQQIETMGKVYADYLKNHDTANKRLQILLNNKAVAIWLIECGRWASDLTTAWNLDALLVKPVQRITKYPLLLTELLSATPSDHPDHDAIANALREVTAISHRINEMKKRADVVTQVIGRKRKESDVRTGLSKVLGRQAGKLKQHVGLAETVEDKVYDDLANRFSENFFHIQLHMRDVEEYTYATERFMDRLAEYAGAIEKFATDPPTSRPELESKWCQFSLAVKDLVKVAMPEHLLAVRKHSIDPMIELLKLHDGPQKVMQKRKDRQYGYLKMKTVEDRGDEPSKKTKLQGTQFIALNETLKEELPKLISLTGKLLEACLINYVQLQTKWHEVIQKRLSPILDRPPQEIEIAQILTDWAGDFDISETQVLGLGICNGSVLADSTNIHNFGSPPSSEPKMSTSSRRPSMVNSITTRGFSTEIGGSPKISLDIGGNRVTNNFAQSNYHTMDINANSQIPLTTVTANGVRASLDTQNQTRSRAASTVARSEIPSFVSLFNPSTRNTTVSMASTAVGQDGHHTPPANNAFRSGSEESPSLPALSLGTPGLEGDNWLKAYLPESSREAPDPNEHPSSPAVAERYSSLFSSAMPMSSDDGNPANHTSNPEGTTNDLGTGPDGIVYMDLDALNARDAIPAPEGCWQRPRYSVLFVAASLFDFHLDPIRTEAGFPYHSYNPGEVFDVIGVKGDLWMARNQDDKRGIIGWVWSRHFHVIG